MRVDLKTNSGRAGTRRRVAFIIATASLAAAAQVASAQYRVGPVYPTNPSNEVRAAAPPRSGDDPLVLEPRTGRFHYVPIPYGPEPPGANYNPYRFHWYSGRWEYVPDVSPL